MFSSIGKYLLERIGGLRVSAEGELMAVAGSYEGHANMTIESARGSATFSWTQANYASARIAVPVGMVAHVHLPVLAGGVSLVGGPLLSSEAMPHGILAVERAHVGGKEFHRVTVQSGHYELTTSPVDTLVI